MTFWSEERQVFQIILSVCVFMLQIQAGDQKQLFSLQSNASTD